MAFSLTHRYEPLLPSILIAFALFLPSVHGGFLSIPSPTAKVAAASSVERPTAHTTAFPQRHQRDIDGGATCGWIDGIRTMGNAYVCGNPDASCRAYSTLFGCCTSDECNFTVSCYNLEDEALCKDSCRETNTVWCVYPKRTCSLCLLSLLLFHFDSQLILVLCLMAAAPTPRARHARQPSCRVLTATTGHNTPTTAAVYRPRATISGRLPPSIVLPLPTWNQYTVDLSISIHAP